MSTKVYQLCTWDTRSNQGWAAVTEHGEVIASHISSSRSWGIHDTGPEGFHADKYPDDAEVIVIPHGEGLPPAVLEANKLWAAVKDEASMDARSEDGCLHPDADDILAGTEPMHGGPE